MTEATNVTKIEDHRPAPTATHVISYQLDGFLITSTIETSTPIRQIVDKLKSVGATPASQPAKHSSTPVCPEHGKAKESKRPGSYYCPTSLPDGGYCKWVGKA